MANARTGNIIYIDTTSNQITTDLNLKVASILFTSSGAGDALELRESSSGTTKVYIKNATANNTEQFIFETPIVFSQGIYVQTLSSGAKAILVLVG